MNYNHQITVTPNSIRAYLRVSSQRQEREETIETQRHELTALVSRTYGADFSNTKTYEDNGYSGSLLSRPGLDNLRADLADPAWNTLVVYNLDRLSRDFNDMNVLVDEILTSGKQIVAVDGQVIKPGQSLLMSRVIGAVADEDKQKILRNLYAGKVARAEAGVINHSTAPYGYTLIPKRGSKSSPDFQQTRLEINDNEAEVVRMIFRWVGEDRCSVYQVVQKLAKLGIRPRKSKRGVWNTSTLNTMLKNETYIGKARFRSSEAVEPKRRLKIKAYYKITKTSRRLRPKEEWMNIDVPAILEGEEGKQLFAKVQQQLKDNRRMASGRKDPNSYLFANRMRCTCGYTRNGSGSGRKKNIYYTCSSRKSRFPEKPCKLGGINARIADEYAWDKLSKVLTDPESLTAAALGYNDDAGTLTSISNELAHMQESISKHQQQIDRAQDAYMGGAFTVQQLKEKTKPLEETIRLQQKRVAELQNELVEKEPVLDQETMQKVLCYAPEALKELDFASRREIVLDVIDEVTAKPGQVVLKGAVPVHQGMRFVTKKTLQNNANGGSIPSSYYVILKTISRNRGSTQRREVDAV